MGDPHISFLWPRRPFGHLSPPRHFQAMPVPKEKEGFREQLERLCELFPERETISMPEACKVVGLCRDTLLQDKTFPAKKPGNRRNGKIVVPLVALARWMV